MNRAVDLFGRSGEGLQIDANDIVMGHRPWQPHKQPPNGESAPIREQRFIEGLLQFDLQLFHFKRADRIGDEINFTYSAPGDKSESVNE